MDDSLRVEVWLPRLTARQMGRGEALYLPKTTSTNAILKELARAGAPHGSLCIAEEQTAGRGRLQRSWHSPAGQGLWLSVLARPQLPAEAIPLLTFCAALSMQRAVADAAGLPVALKWPNDLVCRGKKLCGILLEGAPTPDGSLGVIIGTGLNVLPGAYPPELAHQATSIADEGAAPPRGEILLRYLAALEETIVQVEARGFEGIRADYAAACCTLGSRVNVTGSEHFTGTAEAVDDTGALLVRDDDGTLRRVLAGDVSVRGVMGYV